MLGPNAGRWEKMGSRKIGTHEEDGVLRKIAWKHILRMDQLKKRAYDEREEKRQRQRLRAPGTSGSRPTSSTREKLPRRRRSSSSPFPKRTLRHSPGSFPECSREGFVASPSTLPPLMKAKISTWVVGSSGGPSL